MRFGHEIIPETAKIVQIDTDPDELGRNYPTALSITADAKIALRVIIDEAKRRQPKPPAPITTTSYGSRSMSVMTGSVPSASV